MQIILYKLVIGSRCYIKNNSTDIEIFNGIVNKHILRIKTEDISCGDSILVRIRKASDGVYCKPYENTIVASRFEIKLRVKQKYDILDVPEKINSFNRLKHLLTARQ